MSDAEIINFPSEKTDEKKLANTVEDIMLEIALMFGSFGLEYLKNSSEKLSECGFKEEASVVLIRAIEINQLFLRLTNKG